MTDTNVTNGTSTLQLDTTSMTGGDYLIRAEYQQNNKYNTAKSDTQLLLNTITYYPYGMGTNNPFTDSMWTEDIDTEYGCAYTNYLNTPQIFQHAFTGDFRIKARLQIDCTLNPGQVGFTKNNTLVDSDYSFTCNSSLFQSPDDGHDIGTYEEFILERRGTSYTISKDGNVVSTGSVASVETVYFFMEKIGSCTILCGRIDLDTPYSNGGG